MGDLKALYTQLIASDKDYVGGKEQFLQDVKKNNKNMMLFIIEEGDNAISKQQTTPISKFHALLLIKECVDTGNSEFILQLNSHRQLWYTLEALAAHKKNSKDDDRGKDLFGQTEASLQKFSSLFLRLLLECIASWAEDYPLDHKNRNTKFIALYDKLKKSGVKFPDKKYFFPQVNQSTKKAPKQLKKTFHWEGAYSSLEENYEMLIQSLQAGLVETDLLQAFITEISAKINAITSVMNKMFADGEEVPEEYWNRYTDEANRSESILKAFNDLNSKKINDNTFTQIVLNLLKSKQTPGGPEQVEQQQQNQGQINEEQIQEEREIEEIKDDQEINQIEYQQQQQEQQQQQQEIPGVLASYIEQNQNIVPEQLQNQQQNINLQQNRQVIYEEEEKEEQEFEQLYQQQEQQFQKQQIINQSQQKEQSQPINDSSYSQGIPKPKFLSEIISNKRYNQNSQNIQNWTSQVPAYKSQVEPSFKSLLNLGSDQKIQKDSRLILPKSRMSKIENANDLKPQVQVQVIQAANTEEMEYMKNQLVRLQKVNDITQKELKIIQNECNTWKRDYQITKKDLSLMENEISKLQQELMNTKNEKDINRLSNIQPNETMQRLVREKQVLAKELIIINNENKTRRREHQQQQFDINRLKQVSNVADQVQRQINCLQKELFIINNERLSWIKQHKLQIELDNNKIIQLKHEIKLLNENVNSLKELQQQMVNRQEYEQIVKQNEEFRIQLSQVPKRNDIFKPLRQAPLPNSADLSVVSNKKNNVKQNQSPGFSDFESFINSHDLDNRKSGDLLKASPTSNINQDEIMYPYKNLVDFYVNGSADISGKPIAYDPTLFEDIQSNSQTGIEFMDMKMACLKNQSVIFQNGIIQVGITHENFYDKTTKRIYLKLNISILNKTSQDLNDISIDYDGDQNISMWLKPERFNQILPSGQSGKQQIIIGFNSVPYAFIKIEGDYLLRGKKAQFKFVLPITINKFLSSRPIQQFEYNTYFQDKKFVILKTDHFETDKNLLSKPAQISQYFENIMLLNNNQQNNVKEIHYGCCLFLDHQDNEFIVKIIFRGQRVAVLQLVTRQGYIEIGEYLLQTLMFLLKS